MYNSVTLAGRAVLDLIQRDWEPMTHEELEQRLDRAVEEILEADLIERARVLVGTVFPPEHQVPQQTGDTEQPQPEGSQIVPGTGEENAAVQYIKDILQNSDSSYGRNRRPGRPRLSLNHTVLLSLALLSSRLSYRCVSSRFRVEKGNIHRIFFSFCHRVNALEDQLIRWPAEKEAEQNLQSFCSVTGMEGAKNDLPKVFGALGCTRIPLRGPVGKVQVVGEKLKEKVHPDSWLNLELVCDSRGRFIHCRISRGSDTDRAGALIEKLRSQPEMLPKDSCVIAGLGYPLCGHILTPYPTARSPKQTLYNQSLENHLKVFRRAAAELKSRFRRLQHLDMVNFERARTVVLTACILHNMFLDGGNRFPAKEDVSQVLLVEEEVHVEEDGLRKREAVAELLQRMMDKNKVY